MTAILEPPTTAAPRRLPALSAEFRAVPLAQLHESPLNPRRHFDPKALAELVESLKAKGQLTPCLARPRPQGGYELAAGHRRLRAATAAGLDTLQILVRELSDAEFLEVLTIENLQREDLHPLDEALGYEALIKLPGYDVASVVAKVGKSESYVYQRLKLVDLIEPAKKAFWADTLTAGHAILVARLQPKDQERALKELTEERRYGAGMSVRELAGWIEREIHLDLHGVPFKKDDATLLPAAGACTVCPKRTGFAPALFADIAKHDTCTDRTCFRQKLDAFVERRKAELATDGKQLVQISTNWPAYGQKKPAGILHAGDYFEAKKSDPNAKLAIVVDGRGLGTTQYVTTERPRRDAGGEAGGGNERWRKEQARADAKRKLELEGRRRAVAAILEKVPHPLRVEDLRLIARGCYARLWHDAKQVISKRRGWEKEPAANAAIAAMALPEVGQLLVEVALASATETVYGVEALSLSAAGKLYGVNVQAIKAAVFKEAAAKKRKKPKPVQTSAKAKKTKRAKKATAA